MPKQYFNKEKLKEAFQKIGGQLKESNLFDCLDPGMIH